MIGVFDSGVGGLTVVKEIFKQMPRYQIIYFGDTARLPYGTKGADFVKKYSEKITRWLLKRGAKIIVIACNTSSAWAADYLKKKFPKVPIFEMITPAAEAILDSGAKRIGIIGTSGTIRSKAYEKKIKISKSKIQIYSRACPLLVPLVEEGFVDDKITSKIIKKYLKLLKEKGIDTLLLGCTHYPLLKTAIGKFLGPKVRVINPAEILSKKIKNYILKNKTEIKRSDTHQFFFSDEPYNLKKINRLCFSRRIKPVILDPLE